MLKRLIAVGLLLAFAPVANAGLIDLELVPDIAGPYTGGEYVTVDVLAHDTGVGAVHFRRLALDFSQRDPALVTDPNFTFDFTDAGMGALYGSFPAMDFPSAGFSGVMEMPDFMKSMPADGMIRVGSIGVTVPMAIGDYILDAATVDPNGAGDPRNWGARFDYSFTAPTEVWAGDGGVTGGKLTMTVIPEPATLALLAIGGVAVLRRRR
ncbi:MAG: PEP-CTERM sorting domain-containing protein [Phycisphaerales bacterium]|nr:MAG: PEP-CTERM sorting domain-containing protein [Phycisphaerales bacterium]